MTPEQIATLPDDLLTAAEARPGAADLLRCAAERICDLEEEVLALRQEAERLRGLVRSHRGRRDFMGGKEQCDRDLWSEVLGDGPWGRDIKGDG